MLRRMWNSWFRIEMDFLEALDDREVFWRLCKRDSGNDFIKERFP